MNCWIENTVCPHDHKGLPPLMSGVCKYCYKPKEYEDRIGDFFLSFSGVELEDWIDGYCDILLTEQEIIADKAETLHNIFDIFPEFISDEISKMKKKIENGKFQKVDIGRCKIIFQMAFGEIETLTITDLMIDYLEGENDPPKVLKELKEIFKKNYENFSVIDLPNTHTLKQIFFEIYNR